MDGSMEITDVKVLRVKQVFSWVTLLVAMVTSRF